MRLNDKDEYDDFKDKLARALRVATAKRDMKLIDVAKAAEISSERVYSYAHAKSIPNAYHLMKLAKALKVDVNALLGIKGGAE